MQFGAILYVKHRVLQEVRLDMENKQNVTLSIPKDILRKAKILAVQKNTSLSGLLTQTLVELVEGRKDFEGARRRGLEMLRSGFDLGTGGEIPWKREDLHEPLGA
jgi:hypothetical protein